MISFFENKTEDGNSAIYRHFGGCMNILLSGDLGGGSIKLQASVDGVNFVDMIDPAQDAVISITKAGAFALPNLVNPIQIRLVLSDSTDADVTAVGFAG